MHIQKWQNNQFNYGGHKMVEVEMDDEILEAAL